MTTSAGSLLQWPTTLSVKNLFLMSNLNFPWCSFNPLPCVLSRVTRGRRSAPSTQEEVVGCTKCSQGHFPWASCRLQCGHPPAFSSPSWTNHLTSVARPKPCPLGHSPPWSPSSGHTLIVWCLSYIEVPKITYSAQCGAAPVQHRVGQSPPSTG